jgi:hypothetical protein
MAARRLLIVMLVLLGLSTLAAALVPQRSLRNGTTTSTTTTTPPSTTQAAPPAVFKPTEITVGGRKFPIVYPVRVGDRLTLLVRSTVPTQIEIPEFGQLGFAAPAAPARFELLAREPGTFGILFAPTGKVAAQIRVVPAAKKIRKQKPDRGANPPARGESGPA